MREFTPDEYIEYVRSMYSVRLKPGSKPASPAPGLTVCRTKSGALSIRRASKQRAFDYVTMSEIEKLAKAANCAQSDLWNLFKKRKYIIGRDRMECERAYAQLKGIEL